MSIGSGGFGSHNFSSDRGYAPAPPGVDYHQGENNFIVTLGLSTNGSVVTGNSVAVMAATMAFSCDASTSTTAGPVIPPTQPIGWTPDATITGTWIPDNPVVI